MSYYYATRMTGMCYEMVRVALKSIDTDWITNSESNAQLLIDIEGCSLETTK